METVYNWKLGSIQAKKIFTDKFGNIRENVVKSVTLIFEGKKDEEVKSKSTQVIFNLIDLSDFKDASELNKEEVFEWAMEKLRPLEKASVEKNVKSQFGETEESSIFNLEL